MIEATVEVVTIEHRWRFDVFVSYIKVDRNIIIKDIMLKVNGVFRSCPNWLQDMIREQQIDELINACKEGNDSEQKVL